MTEMSNQNSEKNSVNRKNMESLKSPNNDCVTKQELLGKTVNSLIWSLKIFGG